MYVFLRFCLVVSFCLYWVILSNLRVCNFQFSFLLRTKDGKDLFTTKSRWFIRINYSFIKNASKVYHSRFPFHLSLLT